jgi:hypothetical protein
LGQTSFAQTQGIKFEKPIWKNVLAKAKKDNKMIFVDCHTESCGWCRWMEKHSYSSDTVGAFFNKNFICVSFDVFVGDGMDIHKKYNVVGAPTLLIINQSGEMLLKHAGALSPNEFISFGKDAFDPTKYYSAYLNSYRADPANGDWAYKYFKVLYNANELTPGNLDKYFMTQKDSTISNSKNWKIINSFPLPFAYSNHYLLFEKNLSAFYKLYGRDSVEKVLNSIYDDRMRSAYITKNTKLLNKLKTDFRKLNTADGERILRHVDGKLKILSNTDFNSAIEIEDSIVGPVNVSLGFGLRQEFKYANLSEDNSAWFKFTIAYDTTLTFDIVPIDSLDDYDFALYKCPDGNCIGKDGKQNLVKLRHCFSVCTSKSGMTGLSNYVTETEIGRGPGPAYVSSIHVKAGETYYLMVDFGNEYLGGNHNPLGFTIYFYDYYPRKKPVILNNVLFENNSAVIEDVSFPELDKLVRLLQKTQMIIEIRGHTENIGS